MKCHEVGKIIFSLEIFYENLMKFFGQKSDEVKCHKAMHCKNGIEWPNKFLIKNKKSMR